MNRRKRPGTRESGYGVEHRTRRAILAPLVAAGAVTCWRCGRVIERGSPWDLGHDDVDRRRYRGPEHASCNRSAAARRGNAARNPIPSRSW